MNTILNFPGIGLIGFVLVVAGEWLIVKLCPKFSGAVICAVFLLPAVWLAGVYAVELIRWLAGVF